MALSTSNGKNNLAKNEIWKNYFNPEIVRILCTIQIGLMIVTSGIVILLMTTASALKRPWYIVETFGLAFTILPAVSVAPTFITVVKKSFMTLHITMLTQAVAFGLSLALGIIASIKAVHLKDYVLPHYQRMACFDSNGTLINHSDTYFYYESEKLDCDVRETILEASRGSIMFHNILGGISMISVLVATVIFGMTLSTVWNLRFQLDTFRLKSRKNYSVGKAQLIGWSSFVTSLLICGAQMSMFSLPQLPWSVLQLYSFSSYAVTMNWFLVTEATYLRNVFMMLFHEGCVAGVITIIAVFAENYGSEGFILPIGIIQIFQYAALAGMSLIAIVKADNSNAESPKEAKKAGAQTLI
ncbi:uncharacterized protein LOC110854704 [Folsomia candida]|uniref:uncharacterized protein LOC110854704 n=1 Tax=Folsomia candida TaxID=158441 RepID=UPI001604FC12|nr:uncharacterized protein LOC110854704 [Folsomia candida]XP_035711419.1 uncharacterized protein LOC110854704 [Folsomia candida]